MRSGQELFVKSMQRETQLSLILFTKNRVEFAKRQIIWFSDLDCHLYILDGSEVSDLDEWIRFSNFSNFTKIRYFRDMSSPQKRILKVLDEIETDYIQIITDDDIFSKVQLLEAVEVLTHCPDVSVATSRCYSFLLHGDKLFGREIYKIEPDVLALDRSMRLKPFAESYVPISFYGLCRSRDIIEFYSKIGEIELSSPYAIEVGFEFFQQAIGNVRLLRKIKWLRNLDEEPINDSTWQRSLSFSEWYLGHEWRSEVDQWLGILSELTQIDCGDIRAALSIYVLENPSRKPVLVDFKLFVLVPLRGLAKRLIYRIPVFKGLWDRRRIEALKMNVLVDQFFLGGSSELDEILCFLRERAK